MAMGTITFITFKFFHTQLVSQRVMTEIVYYYITPVHNASLSI
jgi:hypothetical protein